MFVIVELLYGTWGKRKGKENDRASVISHSIRCEGRGYNDVLKTVEKWGMGGVKKSIQRD
jgi:hypothetical protein